jgi:phosphate starvation-inducible PhoH-like protein
LGVGPAGTGKTMFACYSAVRALKAGVVDKIIITRPTVAVDEQLGFLPGTLNQKMDPWVRPLFDLFHEIYSQKEVESLLHLGSIEIAPLAYMRGRTFKNSWIISRVI